MQSGTNGHHVNGSVAAGSTAAPSDQCVLWLARAQTTPEPLAGALKRRGVIVWTCDDPFLALAHACRVHRRPGAASSSSLFICCDPTRQPEVLEMVQHLKLYAPRLGLWWFEDAQSPNLKPITLEDLERWTTPPVNPVQDKAPQTEPKMSAAPSRSQGPQFLPNPIFTTTTMGPGLRLVMGPGTPPPAPSRGSAELLTADELAMLLGPMPPPHSSGRKEPG